MNRYICSVPLYGTESWTLKASTTNRLATFEMRLYRMLRKSWKDLLTNREVLTRARTELELINTINARKIAYLCHVLRGTRYSLLQLTVQGKVECERGHRFHSSRTQSKRSSTEITEERLFGLAEDGEANVWETGHGSRSRGKLSVRLKSFARMVLFLLKRIGPNGPCSEKRTYKFATLGWS